jgi:type II restriction/modification system DNA methylase subunit YeeA
VVDGFDVVIGNPPYVRQEKIKKDKPLLQKQNYEVFTSTADLYVYFYEKGYQLLKQQGVLAYITSNKWMRAKYGENLRKFLKEKTTIIKLIDFGGYRVFEQTVDTCILLFKKEKPPKGHTFEFLTVPSDVEDLENYLENANWQKMEQEKLSNNGWTLGDDKVLSLKEKIEKVGKPLKEWDVKIYFGIKTGYNDAFIIDTETRNRILANCKDEEERRRTEEIIKPVLRGRDIERYRYKWAGLWVICTFPSKKIDIEQYPALKEYLASFGERLLQDGKPGHRKKTPHKWYETQDNIAYYPEFEKEKIVWQEIVREPSFAYDNTGIYVEATGFLMTGKNLKYLLGLLNSKPVAFFFKTFYAGGGLGEDGYRYKKAFLEQLPIPPLTPQTQPLADQIVQKVQEILTLTQSPDFETSQEKQQKVKELEREIDQLVYKLYGLTEEEIEVIEENR